MRKGQLRNFVLAGVGIMLFIAVFALLYFTGILPYWGMPAHEYAVPAEVRAGSAERGEYADNSENNVGGHEITGTSEEQTDFDSTGEDSADYNALRIIVPKVSSRSTMELEDVYMNRQLRLTVGNSVCGAYKKNMILSDNYVVKDIHIKDIISDGGEFVSTVITLDLDGVYEYRLHEENAQYIIELFDIHSVYDKVIVIDAGHGGGDTGCGTRDLQHYEKDITLSVVKLLKEKLDATDIKVYYTRLADETVYLKPRVNIANDVKADMFISIHCNYYDRYWVGGVNGAEALYSSRIKTLKSANRRLAGLMLDNLTKTASIRKRSVINRKKEIFILKKSRVPATIVEMAYLSDINDTKYMVNAKKRKKVVDGLYNGIVEAYKQMYGKTVLESSE
ncbi:MAG: N-acetylmuramoyl-L-alanine amidase [Lachnospiraceae bacterium]|nr:N-acetylmuramoyl-L-alanine amidase [Lachnospiraceae bacterium]